MKLVPKADMGIEQHGLTVQVPKVQFFAVRHGVPGGKGEEQPLRGMICLKGKSLPYHETWRMLENDIGIMEEQPLEQNLVADMTLMDNLCLCLGRKISGLWMGKQYQNSIEMMLRRFIEKRYFGEKIKDLPLQVAYRAVFCKWLLLKRGRGKMPSSVVYRSSDGIQKKKKEHETV